MKKFIILFSMVLSLSLNAQNCDYDFNVSTEAYQDLTNSISLNNGNVWDDPQYAVPIGFNFEICGKTYTTLYISEEGYGGVLLSESNPTGDLSIITPIAQDIEDREMTLGQSSSPISYKIEGTAGSRILKIEWQNVGFWSGGLNDYMNFQLWVYENSNIVEYHYGSSDVPNSSSFEGETGPITAFYPVVNWDTGVFMETGYYLTGSPANPTAVEINVQTDVPANALSGMIPNGTIYTFTPDEFSISDSKKMVFSIFPNPTTDFLYVKTNQITNLLQVDIYNLLGKKVKSVEITKNNSIDISNLSPGMYFVKIQNENRLYETKKIVKR